MFLCLAFHSWDPYFKVVVEGTFNMENTFGMEDTYELDRPYRSQRFFSVYFAIFLAVFFALCKKYRKYLR